MLASPAEPVDAAERMDHHVRMKLRAAAFRATRVFPGAVGEMVSKELLSFEEFGLRLSRDGLVMRVVDQVMNSELPTPHSGVTQSSPIPQPILIVKPAE